MPIPKYTHVVSSTPSRTRLRVSPKRRNHQEMARIANALNAHPEVHEVRTNLQTGSIVVHHTHNEGWQEEMTAILQDLGIILGSVADVEEPLSGGKSEVAGDIASAVKDLNERFGLATNGVVDLRMLFPMGLAALSLRELIQNEWEFETAPWYVLAWYAFDSFIKLHYTSDPDSSTTSSSKK